MMFENVIIFLKHSKMSVGIDLSFQVSMYVQRKGHQKGISKWLIIILAQLIQVKRIFHFFFAFSVFNF